MTITEGPPTVDTPWPVSVLSQKIRGWIERLGTAWVEGDFVHDLVIGAREAAE